MDDVTVANGAPVAIINAPVNPVLGGKWFQLYTKLARPTLDWVGVVATFNMLNIFPILGTPMDEGQLMVALFFVGSLYGIRTYERTRGVA